MSDGNQPERLDELISDRQRYESWLAALQQRREAAPTHVVTRLEQEYRQRLTEIGEELAKRAGELRDRVGALAGRLDQIRQQEMVRRDEKAEAELRTAVGEYSPGRWAEISASADRDLSALESDREVVERELAELERVLQHVIGGPGARPVASAAVAQPDATRTATVRPAQIAQPAAAPRPSNRSAPAPHRATSAGSAKEQPVPDSAPPPRPPPAHAPPVPATSSRSPETQRRKDPSQREGQEKTLLCGECGTANYPTEWYCEACGAELAAL